MPPSRRLCNALFTLTLDCKHDNPIGTVDGGVASTLFDAPWVARARPTSRLGYVTPEWKINLVRPVTEATGPIRAEGRMLQLARGSGTAQGRILDANGPLLAHGTTTCLVFAL